MIFHQHKTHRMISSRVIEAEFGKENLPEGIKPIRSTGWWWICRCGTSLIVHPPEARFAQAWTEIV